MTRGGSHVAGERSDLDLKRAIDWDDPRQRLELIKDLVAMANSGGGTVRIGATETEEIGIDTISASKLDGARISDCLNRYVTPASTSVTHHIHPLDSGRVVIEVSIRGIDKYPLVFAFDGNYAGGNVFRKGDIYVRHGAKSERATHQDIRELIDKAIKESTTYMIDALRRSLDDIVRLPPETQIRVYELPSGTVLASPAILLRLTESRRRRNTGAVLDGRDLLWCFLERRSFHHSPANLSLLIRSALRRVPTLFFWLSETNDRALIENILLNTLEDQDRDKSDAKNSILEVAALLARDEVLEEILARMAQSEYKHFQDAARLWRGRERARKDFDQKVRTTSVGGILATNLGLDNLLHKAEQLAQRLLNSQRTMQAESRLLANLGRVYFAKSFDLVH